MMTSRSYSWTTPAIRIATAGLAATIAGPLGGAIGSWLGDVLGASAGKVIHNYAAKFGEKAGEKLFEYSADALKEKMEGPSSTLETVFREALALSLKDIHARCHFQSLEDWFGNWQSCLATSVPLDLLFITKDQLMPEKLDGLFRSTMERLDAQGAAIQRRDTSIEVAGPEAT